MANSRALKLKYFSFILACVRNKEARVAGADLKGEERVLLKIGCSHKGQTWMLCDQSIMWHIQNMWRKFTGEINAEGASVVLRPRS